MNVSTTYSNGVANVLAGPTGQLTANQALSDYLADAILYNRERKRLMDRRADAASYGGVYNNGAVAPSSGGGRSESAAFSSGMDQPGIPVYTKELTGFNLHGTVKADPWERGAAFAGFAPRHYGKRI
jgi:hypothetical protein